MKKKLLILFSLLLICIKGISQEKKITILVKDEKNKPISGAVILFDNVRQKSWTNSKGIYKAKTVQIPKEISAFSPKIGIKKVKYRGEGKITIIIAQGNDKLLTTNKSKNINPKQFWSIYDYLKGNVAGLHITPNNEIRIRGYGSVNGSMHPLFILNGTNINQETFGMIRPNSIKSVRVLKGPETAAYGSRGANGVIIVKTL